MKLLTINVHSWLEENQLEKLNILAKVIVEKNYDVVAMQEVNMEKKVTVITGLTLTLDLINSKKG